MSILVKLLVKIVSDHCIIFALKWAPCWNFWSKFPQIFVIFLLSNEQRGETFGQNFPQSLLYFWSQMSSVVKLLIKIFSNLCLKWAAWLNLHLGRVSLASSSILRHTSSCAMSIFISHHSFYPWRSSFSAFKEAVRKRGHIWDYCPNCLYQNSSTLSGTLAKFGCHHFWPLAP